MSACTACGTELPAGAKFCFSCGTAQAGGCVACGAELPAGARFCLVCGTAQVDASAHTSAAQPVAARRVTSVLFGDLVGFTSLSEVRDQEEVRELLSSYFENSSRIVERYGGIVEKFIGDAVMAVWGVPTAHEDDAERAVRAGLELVARVAAMGSDLGVPDLAMRVGIVTGEVAVTIGATQQGMVAGDAVNTAARVQSAAAPGQVWVDETTRLLTTSAVTYVDVGSHAMKGKADPVPLWAAQAVVSVVGGGQRADGLEAPLVGRERELRLVKELFHACEETGRPSLLLVDGEAGVGKSRLGWEFEKYTDGVQTTVRWHSGRCLAYGEGVAYYALAEAIRGRLRALAALDETPDGDVPDDEDVAALLALGLAEYVADDEERAWIEPRLGTLLGVAGGTFPREDLFAAWTTFLERVGDGAPVVLVVDDAQHADEGLLTFLEYLLNVGEFSCFVLLLARPTLLETTPALAAARRTTVVHLEPLSDADMGRLLDGLVAGIPDSLRDGLVRRADGLPLYAVETVRSLVDRDLVVPQGGRYVLADRDVDLDAIGSSPSLQALIAARLDALTPAQRRVVDRASVVGTSFDKETILRLCADVDDAEQVLGSLVRAQVMRQEANRFSGEHGRYGFVQDAVRQVAYGSLSRRDRKADHLAVAGLLAEEDDAAALIARHYLDAIDAVPADPDADELTETALDLLVAASTRATELGSLKDAAAHLEIAIERCRDPHRAASLEVDLFPLLNSSGALEEALLHAEHAMHELDRLGDVVRAGEAAAYVATGLVLAHADTERALALAAERSAALEGVDGADAALILLAMARLTAGVRRADPVDEVAVEMLRLAEATGLEQQHLVDGYLALGIHYNVFGPQMLSRLMFEAAADVARAQHDNLNLARVLANLVGLLMNDDLPRAVAVGKEAVEAGRRAGSRRWAEFASANLATAQLLAGNWDDLGEGLDAMASTEDFTVATTSALARAQVAWARNLPVAALDSAIEDPDIQAAVDQVAMLDSATRGDGEAAGRLAIRSVRALHELYGLQQESVWAVALSLHVAISLAQRAAVATLVDLALTSGPGLSLPVRALVARGQAYLARDEADDVEAVPRLLRSAIDAARQWGAFVEAAHCEADLGAWLAKQGRAEEAAPYLASARATYESLGAARWLSELDRATAAVPAQG